MPDLTDQQAAASGEQFGLKDIRGGNYPPPPGSPDYDPKRAEGYVDDLRTRGRVEHQARAKRASYNLLFADGEQFIDFNSRSQMWATMPNPSGRIRMPLNYIKPIQRSRISKMNSTEINWSVRAHNNTFEQRDRAVLARNLLPARWAGSDMDMKVREALFMAFNTGVSFFKQFWNKDEGPLTPATLFIDDGQGNVVETYVDENGTPLAVKPQHEQSEPPEGTFFYRPGETGTALRSTFNLMINPDATGWSTDDGFRYLIDMDVVPLSVVRERYGPKALKVSSTEGIGILRHLLQIARNMANRITGASTVSGQDHLPDHELTLVSEYWEAPSEIFPEGRLIVTAGRELMHDGPLPQGFVPYVAVFDEKRSDDPWGRASVVDLIPPQKVINQQWSLILEEMNRTGIGQWVSWDFPGVPDQVSTQPFGIMKIPQRAMIQSKSISDVIARMPSPTPPRDRWNLLQEARQSMFDIAGFHEVSRGSTPRNVESGVAIELLQESDADQVKDAMKLLKRSLIRWGEQTLQMAKWGYGDNEERWIPVERQDLDFMAEAITGGGVPKLDQIQVDLKGFRPRSQAAIRAEARDLLANQLINPRVAFRMMDMGRGAESLFEGEDRHWARARRENVALEKGQFQILKNPETGAAQVAHLDGTPFLLREFDNGDVHSEVLNAIILDDTQPFQVRQAAILHSFEHQQLAADQAAAAFDQQVEAAADMARAEDAGKIEVEKLRLEAKSKEA